MASWAPGVWGMRQDFGEEAGVTTKARGGYRCATADFKSCSTLVKLALYHIPAAWCRRSSKHRRSVC